MEKGRYYEETVQHCSCWHQLCCLEHCHFIGTELVTAVDSIPEKIKLINNRKSPIRDEYIEKYLAEKELVLTATLDIKVAY